MSSPNWDKEELRRALSDPSLTEAQCCPFCHTARLAIISESLGLTKARKWRVRCSTCLSCGPWHITPEAAVQSWNGSHIQAPPSLPTD